MVKSDLHFIQIYKENKSDVQKFLAMWIEYIREIDADDQSSDLELQSGALGRVNIQGKRNDMYLELCYKEGELIGFIFYAVDLGGIKNIIDAGLGYVMEFYILPQYRRKGYGRKIFRHIESTFSKHGIDQLYLTPSEVDGESFWKVLGFKDSGKIDPGNNIAIYIKS